MPIIRVSSGGYCTHLPWLETMILRDRGLKVPQKRLAIYPSALTLDKG
jgi:hypothetical protein